MSKFYALILLIITLWANSLWAAFIKKLDIQGNERVNKDYIYSLLSIKEGDKYDEDFVALSLKNLYDTDRFSNIEVTFNNNVLTFKLSENPIVNNVIFVGNKNVKENNLLQELSLTKNLPYSERKLSADIKRIRDLYLKSGYLSTQVTPTIARLNYNRVNVVFNINEGKKSTISSVKFIGNDAFSTSTLKKVILTREDKWWRLLNPNYIYDSNRITYDGELLKQYYNEHGYIDFNLLSSFVLINSSNEYQLIFNISEGERFKFSDLKLTINIERLKPYRKVLLKLLDIKDGTWFIKSEVDRIVNDLNKELYNLGFKLAVVSPNITLNTILKKVYVDFEISNSKLSTIERINISGNNRTFDNVIRRSLSVREGDAFTTEVLSRARVEVYNLGYFSSVNVTNSPGSSSDKTLLKVDVNEQQSTGYISLGGGYSTYEGLMLQGSFSEQNLLGSGKGVNITGSISSKQINVDATLFDPYLFDRKVYGSIRVFDTITDRRKYSSYKMNQVGINPAIGYKLSDRVSQSFSYILSSTNIFDVSNNAPPSIKQSAGSRISSIITHNIQYDKRDNTVFPTHGYLVSLNTDFAGLGGNVYYLRNTINNSIYKALYNNIVFSLVSSVGHINKIRHKKNILISDKFFLGGSSLRGFDWSGVGPRDKKTGDALGGNTMLRFSAQIDFPIPLVDNFGLLFHVFNDNGTVYNVDSVDKYIVKSMKLRSSIGFGISWRSPFGIIALDWGWPLKQQPEDRLQRFLLSFGARI